MLKTCVVCGNLSLLKGINAKYMAPVCSSKCLATLLHIDSKEGNPLSIKGVELNQEIVYEMRSSYERGFAKWLKDNNITFFYEPFRMTVQKNRRYLPDFYLLRSKIFIEVKGKWEGSGKAKFKYFRDHYPYPIYIMDKEAMKLIGCRPEKGAFYGGIS